MMPAEIQRFFERYRDAFNALDGDAVAALYAVPSAIVDSASHTQWSDAGPIRDNMRALCELYRQHGYRKADFTERAFLEQGEDFAVADIHWHIERDDAPAWEFRTTYNLQRQQGQWRVLLCTAYNEQRLSSHERT
jgi:ketosteroid isomerase-like protein